MLVNAEEIFDEDKLLWHDKSFVYEKICEDNEEINIEIEVKTIFDYYPQLKTDFKQINNVKDINNIKKLHNIIKEYLAYEKSLKNGIELNSEVMGLYNFYKKNNLIDNSNKDLFSSYEVFKGAYSDFNFTEASDSDERIYIAAICNKG